MFKWRFNNVVEEEEEVVYIKPNRCLEELRNRYRICFQIFWMHILI